MKKGIMAMVFLGLSASALAAGDLKAGALKAKVCMGCHGAKGISALGQFPNLAGQGEKYIIKQLHDFKSGARQNPIMKAQASLLSNQDIENVAAYFSSLPPAPAATNGAGPDPVALLNLGKNLYRGGDMEKHIPACMACHGPTGAGIEPAAFPRLGAQKPKYLRAQLNAFKNAAGAADLATDAKLSSITMRSNDMNGMMRDIASRLTPKQIEAIAYYVQGLH